MSVMRVVSIAMLSCIIFTVMVYRVNRIVYNPHTISYVGDALLSSSARSQLKSLLTCKLISTTNARDLLARIKTVMPAITALSIHRQRPGHAHVNLKTALPVLALNDKFVLTHNGSIVNENIFNEQILQGITRINVSDYALKTQASSAAHDISTFVTHLPDSIRSHYDISWQDRTTITLAKKTGPAYRILCDATTRFSNKLLQALKNIETIIQQRTMRKKSIVWQTDIRFNSFIVLSSTLGEKL